MDNLTNGTEVLLFKNTTNDIYEDTKKYINYFYDIIKI